MRPPAPKPTDAPESLYPRRCDRIARSAHGTFLYAVGGGLVAALLWAGLTELDKVTRGAGRVVPILQNQLVQHLEGGIIREILVREGEAVQRGQPLMRIENSFSQAELSQARLEIRAKRVKLARLEAERGGADQVTYADDQRGDPGLVEIMARETQLFRTRRDSQREQVGIIDDQIRQKELELSEFRSRWTNTRRERDLLAQRVESLRRLVRVGAVSQNELLDNERSLAQLDTRLSDLMHDMPRTEASISEMQRRRTDTTLRFRADAEKEISETVLAIAKLQETITAMTDRSTRSEVLAPIDGVVNRLHVTTVGGVVRGGEPLAQIVPADTRIAVEARLAPADRAEVWPGLPAVVKISAYEFSIFGGLHGRVVEVSPDALTDEQGRPYFRVRLEASAASFGPNRPVVPGMLADVDILSGRHTILDYVLKPVRRLRDNALRQ
jgi:HlyD family type I secretion membrane fusion protein